MVYARVCTAGGDTDDERDASPSGAPPHKRQEVQTPDRTGAQAQQPQWDEDPFGLFTDTSTRSTTTAQPQQSRPAAAEPQEASGPRLDFAPVLDFEERDGAVNEQQRQLLLYAVPLTRDEQHPVQGLVFLPVSSFREAEDPDKDKGLVGGLKKRLGDQWDELKASEPGTFSHKVYKVGHRLANNQTPEERLVRNIPKKVSKVIIHHPASIPPDVVAERLLSMTQQGALSTAKAAVAALMLPIAFGIDIILIPGPSILTYLTGYQLYKHASNAAGTLALKRLLVEQQGGAPAEEGGEPERVRINYAPDLRLDECLELTQASPDGLLPEEACERLVEDLGQPELLEPLLELRKRARAPGMEGSRVDERGNEYQPLTASDHH